MENNMNPAEELKNQIDSAIETKANEAVTKATEMAQETKSELADAITKSAEAQAEANALLQKQIDDMRKEKSSGAAFGISKKRTEFEDMFDKAASDYKSSGKSTMELDTKTFVAGASTNTIVPSAYGTENMIKHLPNYKVQLRDVLNSRTESGGSILWNRETAETDSSAGKAFGAAQPQTSKTVTRQEATFKTLANFYTMPEEYFNDIANFESYISNRLMGDLMDLESRQIIGGSGTGQNYNGLNTFGTALDSDADLGNWANSIANPNRFDCITAVASILAQEDFNADVVILNPFDYYQMSLAKTTGTASNGDYVLTTALDANGLLRTYWNGVEVIKSNAQNANTFTVIDKSAADYVMRKGISLEFDRNANDFQTYSVSVRALIRGEIADWLPTAVKTGTFTGATGLITLLSDA